MNQRYGLLVFLLAAGGLPACSGPPATEAATAREPVAVALATARSQPLPDRLEASATLVAPRRASPGTRILGRIDRVLVREGDAVAAGALLARIESRDLAAGLAQAQAGVAMAETRQLNAAAMARRLRELHGRGSATAKSLEDAVTGEDLAAAGVSQALANLEAARAAISYAEVRSPIAGWVVSRSAEVGDLAVPGVPLFAIEDLSLLEASAVFPESSVAGLSPGRTARIVIDALGLVRTSTLDRLIPAGDPASRSFEARFRLENPDGVLKSGLFARIEMPLESSRPALLVESTAVAARGQLRSLFVAQADRARLRFLKVGRPGEVTDRIEILAGLAAGESYLVSPPAGLRDGDPIVALEGGSR